jgi:hypothetical protein
MSKVKSLMTRRRKLILWLGLCLSLPATAYAALGVVYFVWLESLMQWPAHSAAVVAFALLALAVLCAGVFIYCLASLIKAVNRAYRGEQSET